MNVSIPTDYTAACRAISLDSSVSFEECEGNKILKQFEDYALRQITEKRNVIVKCGVNNDTRLRNEIAKIKKAIEASKSIRVGELTEREIIKMLDVDEKLTTHASHIAICFAKFGD